MVGSIPVLYDKFYHTEFWEFSGNDGNNRWKICNSVEVPKEPKSSVFFYSTRKDLKVNFAVASLLFRELILE